MKILLNSNLLPIFCGTYETHWEIDEYEDNGDQVEVDYDLKDFMLSIIEAYKENEDYILKYFNIDFVKKIKFTGTFFNPREYNFATDQIDFEITIDKKSMLKTLKSLKENKRFAKYLKDNFSSYDGFMSFTPNNYNDLYREIITEGDELEQSISALIKFLSREKLQELDLDMFEYWQGQGYMGLDYTEIKE